MSKIKLIDFIKVNPDPKFANLSKRDKLKLMDSIVTRQDNSGLLITYDLSHSGRRINNRIYSTQGQQDGINSILNPYPKPILIHHDGDSDPIGRFVRGEWQDLSNQGLGFFDDVKDFMEVKNAFLKDNPKKIYSVMKKFNLLTDKNWPGLGRMRVQARISDTKAIEKFLDGRYITFSAGSTTDRHVCSICQTDWADGDICEHRHGKIYDGDICVFITGKFEVLEGSVVNMPADDLSQILSMEMTDLPNNLSSHSDNCMVDQDTIYLSDSIYKMESIMEETINTEVSKENSPEEDTAEVKMETSDVEETNTDDASSELIENGKAIEEEESIELQEETSSETLSDSTNEEVIATTSEDNKIDRILEVFNKLLNKIDEEKVLRRTEQHDKAISSVEETIVVESTDSEEKAEAEEAQENFQEASDGTEEKRVQIDSNTVLGGDFDLDNDTVEGDFDWYLLEAGLALELGDAKLSTEKRNELPSSSFCGPERSFPVPDCAHVTAARRLINRAKLSTSQKEKVLACVSRKAKNLSCDSEDLSLEYEALKQDHKVILKRVEWLEAKLHDLLDFLAKISNKDFSETEDSNKLESMLDWFNEKNSTKDTVPKREITAKIENPSVASTDVAKKSTFEELGSFEKVVVKEYDNLISTKGLDAANYYLASKRRYLPRGFHPNNFIGD